MAHDKGRSINPGRNVRAIGGLLLTGWALYISVVTVSNLSDLMSSFGWEQWAFKSGNLGYIAEATELYFRSEALNQVLLAAVILWEATAAVLLWQAAVSWARTGPVPERARTALSTLVMLWFAFAIATELFVAYDRGVDESAYWTLAAAVLASLIVLEVIARPAMSLTNERPVAPTVEPHAPGGTVPPPGE